MPRDIHEPTDSTQVEERIAIFNGETSPTKTKTKSLSTLDKLKLRLATSGMLKGVPKPPGQRKKRRTKHAISEIKKYQKSTDLLIRKTPMKRLIREILVENLKDARIRPEAVMAIHSGAEAYLTRLMELCAEFCHHRGRITPNRRDVKLAGHLLSGRLEPLMDDKKPSQ